MDRAALPAFPAGRAAPEDPMLDAAGLRLRPATADDLEFLRQLHAEWRMSELLFLPWTAAEKQAFADDQFQLQHCHVVRHFPDADFWIVTDRSARPIGRLYLDGAPAEWRLVDILLASSAQGQGLGTRLIEWIQHEAGGTPVRLHVALNNPRAHALYLRLGFTDVPNADGMHRPMLWRSDAEGASRTGDQARSG
jgi:RimJ/RimL family protein N-acetyltransferase